MFYPTIYSETGGQKSHTTSPITGQNFIQADIKVCKLNYQNFSQ